jgi:imidazolonepropionase-like amidohydrolase
MRSIMMQVFSAFAVFCCAMIAQASAEVLVLKGGTVITAPGEKPIAKGVVVIEDGVITAVGKKGGVRIPDDAIVLDLKGMTVTAGFWNSHVHFLERKWAAAAELPAEELEVQLEEMFTQYGVTSVFDLSSDIENTAVLRDRINSGEVNGPRILRVGLGITAPGDELSDMVLAFMGWMNTPLIEAEDADAAGQAAETLLSSGVDGIKLFPTRQGQPLTPAMIAAVTDAAHEAGKPVFFHPNTPAEIADALGAGVDVIVHTTPRSGPWGDDILDFPAERRAALTPTLSLWMNYARHDRASAQEARADTITGQLRDWIDAGGIVLFGTDAGTAAYDPSTEYLLMQRAGMAFDAILASLTTAPADFFGEGDKRGRIAPGLAADIAVLGGDPVALTDVRYVIRDGRVIFKKEQPKQ